MNIHTGTRTIYRFCHPTLVTCMYLAQCFTSIAIIVADNGVRWTQLTMHCVRHCLSISNVTSLLSPAISLDGFLPQSIVTDNMYRYINLYAINLQRLSMDSLHSLLWQAMAIDRHIAQSIVAGNGHRWTRLTINFLRQCQSIDSITHLLSPTISIDGYLSQPIVADNIYLWIPFTT